MTKPEILIVDDDEAFCRELVRALGQRGIAANWTASPVELSKGLCGTPDIVLLDLGMPGIDGFEVIEAISRFAVKPHIIVASGYSDRIINAAAKSAIGFGIPVLGRLEKPYSLIELIKILDRFCSADGQSGPDKAALVQDLIIDGKLLDHVCVAFQTKRRLSNQIVIGHEALLRLDIDRSISPELVFSDMVPAHIQLEVTEAVLRGAMQFAAEIFKSGRFEPISINCSPTVLCAAELMPMISRALADFAIPPKMLVLELTEHHSIEALDTIAVAASRLALRGCGIAIDDFGRGTTSLERLLELPISEVKIDREIFQNCVEQELSRPILQEVIRFCRSHQIDCVVEGIETDQHRLLALGLGAEFGQGYLWGKPEIRDTCGAGPVRANAPVDKG